MSDTHKGHTISTLEDIYRSRKEGISKDTEELENIISPCYEEIATDLETRIDDLDKDYEKLVTALSDHEEDWHRKITSIANKVKDGIKEIKVKHISILKEHLDEIKQILIQIKQTRLNLLTIDDSNKVILTMEYRSKNEEFRKLPQKFHVSPPNFNPKTIDTEQLSELFGSLTPLSIIREAIRYKARKPHTSTEHFLRDPKVITSINTGNENLCSVTCLSDENIWINAFDTRSTDMKCFNIQGTVMNTIKTKTGNWSNDIAVTGDGDLLYSSGTSRTVNRVKSGQTEELFRLLGWIPNNLCVTSSGDLLVTMYSNDKTQSRVARYSGSREKQTIRFDDDGKALYSGTDSIKCITENRNLDICVADFNACAVVVVNHTGNLRFRYTGFCFSSKPQLFKPFGITTDSQSQILTSNYHNDSIYILDSDGEFLTLIDCCDLKTPTGLCVDSNDFLFVAEYDSGLVKKIQYLKQK
ncbi:uncharacterized protein LOC134248189 [Saccostrea cucullata]|uniref:uncharacterized protein LOC134248189 n=1 Tax=Saccostrea cuccullata TaxID=36930 RepID=UPI002ED03AFF